MVEGGTGRGHGALMTTILNMELPEASAERLNALVEMTGAANVFEVIAEALSIYEALVDAVESGGEAQIVTATGEVRSIFARAEEEDDHARH